MSEILGYNGDVDMVSRWAQEMMGYHFSVLCYPACMMIDVDSLTFWFSNLTAKYTQVATLLLHVDYKKQPAAYSDTLACF